MTHLAIVTGASRGIGRAIARRLASAGISVAAVARTLSPGTGELSGSLAETVDTIRAEGGVAQPFVADLSDADLDRTALVATIADAMGTDVDILVNNAAGPYRYEVSLLDMRRSYFAETVEVNVWNTWDMIKAVVPGMRRSGAGWIVNISSRLAAPRVGPPFQAHQLGGSVLYGSTKAMLDRVSTGAAMELYDDNIAVNALAPNRSVDTEQVQRYIKGWPAEPEETMAEATLLLCTADPAQVTGRVAYSLPLLKEFDRAVMTLDGAAPLPGWQPQDLDDSSFLSDYLLFPQAPKVVLPQDR